MRLRGDKEAGPTGTPRGIREARLPDDSNFAPRLEQETGKSAYPGVHPALARLSGLLGREAAAFSRRHRYAGLGRLQLIWSQFMQDNGEDDL
jgi:hypothetical protein